MRRKFTLEQAEAARPLVRSILADLTAATMAVRLLESRAARLQRGRRSGDYAVRQSCYDATKRLQQAHADLLRRRSEMRRFGAVVIDPVRGTAGLPFRCRSGAGRRKRPALFLVKLQHDEARPIVTWCFRDDPRELDVPSAWRGRKPLAAAR